MNRPRWRKLSRDIWFTRARIGSMVLAIAISVGAVTAFLSARAILGREITGNYLSGNPASATLHLTTPVQATDIATALSVPGVTNAVARDSILARIKVEGGSWKPLLLFVSAPDDPRKMSTVTVEKGTWPPNGNGLFIERTALPFLNAKVGQQVKVLAPGGHEVSMTISGSVHDAGVAPAFQERTAYGQITTPELSLLGQPAQLTELKIAVGNGHGLSGDRVAIAQTAQRVGAALAAQGRKVTIIDIPPPLRHPHYGQMLTVGFVLLAFGLISLFLSSILVATMLGALLTQQIRQIGAMKAIGARTGQLFAMYLSMTAGLAAAATAIAIYPGIRLGQVLAKQGAGLLNLDITSQTIPAWVIAIVLVTGIGIPVLVSIPPLVRGTRRTVREAIDDNGSDATGTTGRAGAWLGRVARLGRNEVMAIRNLTRRPGRLALTVGLLAVAGATFLTGFNSATGWNGLVQDGVAHRHYDLEIGLAGPTQSASLLSTALQVPGVKSAEAWGREPTAVSRPGQIDVAHVYPDDSHGSFTVMAPPANTPLMSLPLKSGRWLQNNDTNAVVLTNLVGVQQIPGVKVGDTIHLTVGGRPTAWQVVGIVSDFGTQATAYVTDHEYAAVTGTTGTAGMLRVVTNVHDAAGRQAVLDRLEQSLNANGFRVAVGITTDDLRKALDGHVFVLIEALIAIALIIAFVGLLGLASAMSTSVTERTREFGVMHAIGATSSRIRGIVVTEGVFTGLAGLLIAAVVAVPLTKVFGMFLGQMAFKQVLPYTFSIAPLLVWTLLTLLGASLATSSAARRASRLTVREAFTVI